MEQLGFLLVVLVFAVVWGWQFIQLMVLADTDFPGRYDKPLWVAAFVFVIPVAPFAFMYWRQTYLEVKRQERDGDEDESV